ncbi:MAG: amino acid dehydrogenase [bacterium]|nr:amino acid dehydrogenase [bacterium]
MDRDLLSLIEAWDGNGVVTRFDRPTGTWIFIALHDDTLGPPAGGTRMKVYPALADGLRDAMRLAEGMTFKWAGLGLKFGGGKAVLAIKQPLEGEQRRGLLLRYGALIESLRGAFCTGADLGTSAGDMSTIAEACHHVLGIDYGSRTSTDPGPYTAHGVLRGLQAALAQSFGSEALDGREVLVQGLGGVGLPLARSLARGGARVLLSDLDDRRVEVLKQELGCESVAPADVYSTPCDVYAPCAVGATLNPRTIPTLACKAVAGSANNQLLEAEDAERLHQRGILYVPDYIINSGGALSFSLMAEGIRDEESLMREVDRVGTAVAEILREAAEADISPFVAARRRTQRILAEHRAPVDA